MALLTLIWADVSVGRMPADGVVELVEVGADGLERSSAAGPGLSVDEVLLQRAEEGLHDGVVSAVALSAHGALGAGPVQQFPVGLACVLASTVAVVDEPWLWAAGDQSLVQSFDAQLLPHVPASTQPTTFVPLWSREQIEDHSYVEPAFCGGDEVMSAAQTLFGASTSKFRSSRFSATGC